MEAVRLLVQLSKPEMNSCLTASRSSSVTGSPVVRPEPCRDMSRGLFPNRMVLPSFLMVSLRSLRWQQGIAFYGRLFFLLGQFISRMDLPSCLAVQRLVAVWRWCPELSSPCSPRFMACWTTATLAHVCPFQTKDFGLGRGLRASSR